MAVVRIVPKQDLNGKPYFVIQEQVTPDGKYIDWEGIYATQESAIRVATEGG